MYNFKKSKWGESFCANKIFDNRNINRFKRMRFVAERDCPLTFGYASDERFICEFEIKNGTRRIFRYDFVMSN